MGELLPFQRPPQDPDTEPCPNCGHQVDVAAIRCRRCGATTLRAMGKSTGIPWWLLLGILLALAVVLGWLFRR
jgi:hypothetical protein